MVNLNLILNKRYALIICQTLLIITFTNIGIFSLIEVNSQSKMLKYSDETHYTFTDYGQSITTENVGNVITDYDKLVSIHISNPGWTISDKNDYFDLINIQGSRLDGIQSFMLSVKDFTQVPETNFESINSPSGYFGQTVGEELMNSLQKSDDILDTVTVIESDTTGKKYKIEDILQYIQYNK